jgi:diacylglycerol kinase (CTP)|tara:strand:+ start:7380 stop:7973 length:594 start_codon:yes stop_codon:yes gene_type:complete
MEKRNIETKRKILHLLFGIVLVLLIKYGFMGKVHIFSSIVIALLISFLSKRYKIPGVNWFLHNFEREENIKKFPAKGFIFYLIGTFLVLLFFPKDIAMSAILVLAFADSIGHIFGIKFGRIRHPFVSTKFIEGWIVGFIAGFIAASIVVPWYEALAASFFAMLVEGIEVKIGADEVDDNLIIPPVAAIAVWIVRTVF